MAWRQGRNRICDLRTWALLLAAVFVAIAGSSLLFGPQDARSQAPASGTAISIELDGSIDPATEDWIDDALRQAAEDGAPLAIIRLNTPGGLDTSMRAIVRDIIEAPMPVVVYVSPDGARAASAGLFVTEAADVAAMAPQTNIGSATPISLDGSDLSDDLGRKIENDAAAYVRALAETHGRNPDLAEEMVREATNVDAQTALDKGLIDLIAANQDELLAALDGFEVQGPKAQTLDTEGMQIENRDMTFSYELLQILVNPNVAYLLLLVGIVGILIEVFSPGAIIPGALGAVSFLLGLYGSSQLPVTVIGVLLLVLGIALIIAEAHLPTGGIVGVIGIISLAAAGLLFYDTGSTGLEVEPPLIVAITLVAGGLLALIIKKVLEARAGPVHTGHEELIGMRGEVRVPVGPGRDAVGQVFVGGALWRAEPAGPGLQMGRGDRVRVQSVDGLTLIVSSADIEASDADAAPKPQGG